MAREGRRGRRARHRRRHVDRGAPRALRRPRPGAARAPHPEPRRDRARAHDPLPRRPAGGEPEPRPRRPVRGLARARPELRLAAVPRPAGPPHAGRPALAHRREHVARARASAPAPGRSSPRSCCGRRRARACSSGSPASAAPERGCPRSGALWEDPARRSGGRRTTIRRGRISERGLALPSPARAPRFSMSQISTLAASFADDLDAYAAAGLDGIGIWELKLPRGRRRRRGARGVRAERARVRVGGAARAVDPAAAAARRADRPGRAHRRASARRSTGSRPSARAASSA